MLTVDYDAVDGEVADAVDDDVCDHAVGRDYDVNDDAVDTCHVIGLMLMMMEDEGVYVVDDCV